MSAPRYSFLVSMDQNSLILSVLPEVFAIVRLGPDAVTPSWCDYLLSSLCSVTRTDDELSIVCPEEWVPDDQKADRKWRAFKVKGPLDLSLTGIFLKLSKPLAEAKIPVFALSTFDTDYLLVKADQLDRATEVLSEVCDIRELA